MRERHIIFPVPGKLWKKATEDDYLNDTIANLKSQLLSHKNSFGMNAARHEKCRSRNNAARFYASYCGNFGDGAQSQDVSYTPTRVKVCFTLPFHYVFNVDTFSLTIRLISIKLSQYFSYIVDISP